MTQPDRIQSIRELFPKCAYCGLSLAETSDDDVLEVNGRNRLAHRDCLAAEAEADHVA